MPFLILQDYSSTIEAANLQQIISEVDAHRVTKEQAALAEIKSYIAGKYDVTDLFRETLKFSYTATYKAKQLVYLDATAYSPSALYALNALTLYQGDVYYCSVAITVAEAFTANHWTKLGAQYSLWYIPTPYPQFDKNTRYFKDDLVWHGDKVYPCLRDSTYLDHASAIQYNDYNTMPLLNEVPDARGQGQWGAGVAYSFSGFFMGGTAADYSSVTTYTAGQRALNGGIVWQAQKSSTGIVPGEDYTAWLPISWVSGDNRNQQMVESMIHISLYKLSSRISPRNVPDLWVKNYDDAITWLKMCVKGDVTLDAPLIQTQQTGRIRWGSQPERNNSY